MTIPRIPDAPTCLHCGAALVDIGPDRICIACDEAGWCRQCGEVETWDGEDERTHICLSCQTPH